MPMLDPESQEERFRALHAELQEMRERILRQVEVARRQCAQAARERANCRPLRRWFIRPGPRPRLR